MEGFYDINLNNKKQNANEEDLPMFLVLGALHIKNKEDEKEFFASIEELLKDEKHRKIILKHCLIILNNLIGYKNETFFYKVVCEF